MKYVLANLEDFPGPSAPNMVGRLLRHYESETPFKLARARPLV